MMKDVENKRDLTENKKDKDIKELIFKTFGIVLLFSILVMYIIVLCILHDIQTTITNHFNNNLDFARLTKSVLL